MKKTKFTEAQIVNAISEHEKGRRVSLGWNFLFMTIFLLNAKFRIQLNKAFDQFFEYHCFTMDHVFLHDDIVSLVFIQKLVGWYEGDCVPPQCGVINPRQSAVVHSMKNNCIVQFKIA
ncbi:MAG: hypothetical protein ABIY90_13215 [Puia sp.]